MGGTDHNVSPDEVSPELQRRLLTSRFRVVAYNAIRGGVPVDELHSVLTAADDAAALAGQDDQPASPGGERPLLRLVDS